MDTDSPPTRIEGRYQPTGNVLGAGGMGQVIEAFDRRLRRPVAIKVLAQNLASDERVRDRFEREARISALLAHPGIVTIFDVTEIDGNPAIVMEKLPGGSLADRIREGALTPGETLRIAKAVVAALGHAHDRGVIHRDVKPGNILLCEDGRAKIVDLGIAKSLGEDLTRTNELLGSPAYLAPELLRGHQASPASDLYALGVTMYECLTGEKPFQADTPWGILSAIQLHRYPRLSEVRADLSPEILELVESAMAASTKDRFDSAAEMLEAISDAAAGVGSQRVTRSLPTDATRKLEPETESREHTMILESAGGPDDTLWMGREYETPRLFDLRKFVAPLVRSRMWLARGVLAAILVISGIAILSGDDGATAQTPRRDSATLGPRMESAMIELEKAVRP